MLKKIIITVVGVTLLGVAYYGISPLFINIKVDEVAPELQAESGTLPTSLQGSPVIGTVGHPASGMARVAVADGKTYIRYENFKTLNGPDIYVYLAKDLEAKEFVNLGRVKATEGNINYEIPMGVDVGEYRYVLTWCKAFGVLFNSADLSQR